MSAPYYVALYGGFLVIESYDTVDSVRTKAYTVADVRLAEPFDTFDQADAAAKWAVNKLYPPDLRYFAILAASFGTED
jgi:hypothetical protein